MPPLKIFAIVLFILMYVLMVLLPKYDWNVLMMLFGTMVIVDYFIESKMPNKIAEWLLRLAPNVLWVTVLMSAFSGIISAFIDNVATVLMVAPVGLAICKKLKISPVTMILCIAVSSNLQGAATLVGDTTSIMLGGAANMNFNDFFWMLGRPGMFFATDDPDHHVPVPQGQGAR